MTRLTTMTAATERMHTRTIVFLSFATGASTSDISISATIAHSVPGSGAK